MKSIIKILGGILFGSLISCSNAKSDSKLVQENKWIIIKCITSEPVEINKTGEASTNLLKQSSACALDDIYDFEENGDLIVDNAELTCDLPKTLKGSWSFNGEDSMKIHFPLAKNPYHFKIISINNQNMVLQTRLPFLPENVEVEYTFSKTK